MKFIFIFISLFLFACVQTGEERRNCIPSNNNNSRAEKRDSVYQTLEELCTKIFVADSGYIVRDDAVHFLLAMGMTDTTGETKQGSGSGWYLLKRSDTLGKYYYHPKNGNFLMCLLDYGKTDGWETHVLSEFEIKDGKWSLIAKERYHHGNYPSCWPNYYDGFEKHGGLFSISLCGTGSGFSSTNKQFFSTVVEQNWNNTICTDIFQGGEMDFDQLLTSKIKITNGKVIVDYTYKEENEDSVKLRYSFKLKYEQIDGKLLLRDSTALKKYNEIGPMFLEL